MANNRMFLVHVPTGLAVQLGKRMGWGWYMSEEAEKTVGAKINSLFETLERDFNYCGKQDDFSLEMEDLGESTLSHGKWVYGPRRDDGLYQLIMDKDSFSSAA